MSSQFEDQTLTCKDCHKDFIFDAGEAAYFANKGFTAPKRCKECRQTNKARLVRDGIAKPKEGQSEVNCSECGALTTAPFVPSAGRPVYCIPCLKRREVTWE